MIGITSIPFIGTINTEKIKRASKLGIDFLEWVCEYPHCYPPHISKRARLKLRRMSSEYDLKFSVHSTYVELDIAYLNPGLQEESVRQVKECIRFAADIGAERLITHPGSLPIIPRSIPKRAMKLIGPEDFRKMFLKTSKARIAELREFADEQGITLCVENMHFDFDFCNTLEELLFILGDGFAAFDMGHANIVGDPVKFAEDIKHKIRYVHVHDNYGKEDEHSPLGEGNIDYEKAIRIIGDNYYSYEPRKLEIDSIKDTLTILRRILG
ncbi:MAG: sugar phosphate isomerase/epimerase family protein [Halobacteriota archaeon]|nr:sugar phosphate isomerase/epimerase family protein [Halobacteriota archaeon]